MQEPEVPQVVKQEIIPDASLTEKVIKKIVPNVDFLKSGTLTDKEQQFIAEFQR